MKLAALFDVEIGDRIAVDQNDDTLGRRALRRRCNDGQRKPDGGGKAAQRGREGGLGLEVRFEFHRVRHCILWRRILLATCFAVMPRSGLAGSGSDYNPAGPLLTVWLTDVPPSVRSVICSMIRSSRVATPL